MPQHIGIVAVSAEGASLCYRTICTEAPRLMGTYAHPEVTLSSLSFADYIECQDRGDLRGVGELMLRSADKLAAAGADFLICPDNTVHTAFAHVEPRSPLPWLHIAEVVADEAARRGFRRLGLLGTRWLVESDVYPGRLAPRGLECVRPDAGERDTTHHVIMDELVHGVFAPTSTARVQAIIELLRGAGCDAVVLGCTELPLILDDTNSALPTLDSTRLLARAAIRRAAGA